MPKMKMIVLILVIADWLAVMAWAAVIFALPGLLRIFGPLVCTKDERLLVRSFRSDRSRGISITCEEGDSSRDVKWPVLFLLFATLLLCSLPIVAAIAFFVPPLLNAP